MKKALLSLLLAIVCMPMAFGQAKAGQLFTTDTLVCNSFLWTVNGQTYNHDTVALYQQGDSTYVLNLTVRSLNYDTVDAREVTGNCFASWNNKKWETAGEFFDTIPMTGQCDSVVKILITLNVGDTTWTTQAACDTLFFRGDTLTASGDFFHLDTATATTDCKVYGVHLTIAHHYRDTTAVVVRDTTGGCRINWLGRDYSFNDTDSIIYGMGRTSVANCDSLMAIRITSLSGIQHDTTFVENCGKYTWAANRNREYDATGVYSFTDTSVANCVNHKYLALTIISLHDTVTRKACESYTYSFSSRSGIAGAPNDRATFTTSGIYDTDMTGDTLYSTHFNTRCRTYHTLKLTIDTVEICNRNFIDTATVCDKYTFYFSGIQRTLTESVDTTLVRNVRYGDYCYDSVGRVIVTVKHKSYKDYNESACDSYYWPFTGETYTSSTTKEVVLDSIKNAEGCDSIGRLKLTVNYTPEVTIEGNWHLNPDSANSTTLTAVDNADDHNTYKWFKDNATSPFSTSKTVEVTNIDRNTDIRLETKSNKGCTANNWITITYTVGIDDVEALSVNLYPNPASRYLNVESAEGIKQVVVYNAIGQQVLIRDINANAAHLDLSTLATGSYTLQIQALNGEQATRKFIVNK